jgi:hypothetical protein
MNYFWNRITGLRTLLHINLLLFFKFRHLFNQHTRKLVKSVLTVILTIYANSDTNNLC